MGIPSRFYSEQSQHERQALQECISRGNPSSDLRCGDGFDCVNDVWAVVLTHEGHWQEFIAPWFCFIGDCEPTVSTKRFSKWDVTRMIGLSYEWESRRTKSSDEGPSPCLYTSRFIANTGCEIPFDGTSDSFSHLVRKRHYSELRENLFLLWTHVQKGLIPNQIWRLNLCKTNVYENVLVSEASFSLNRIFFWKAICSFISLKFQICCGCHGKVS